MEIDEIIENALAVRASDIHIDPTADVLSVQYRVDGNLQLYKKYPLSLVENIILRIKVLARLPVDDKRLPKDGRFTWSKEALKVEIRVSMMPTSHGENAVLRIFNPSISVFTLEELGFSKEHVRSIVRSLFAAPGLIVVAGPTGSGKTTTLYSIISHLKKEGKLIVSVEDPIERKIDGVRQIEVGGPTVLEYVTVLRSILRQDPDSIIIGEIRDKESAELAAQSALTGHLVVSTLHAKSAFDVTNRLVHMGVPKYLIDATLVTAFSQRLVRKICSHCAVIDDHSHSYSEWFAKENISLPSSFLKKGKGCKHCGWSGVSGRMVVAEILEEKIPLHIDAAYKAAEGLIPFSEVLKVKAESHG